MLFDKEVSDRLDPELEARLRAQEQVDARRNSNNNSVLEESQDNEVKVTTTVDESGNRITGPVEITGTPGHPASGKVSLIESPAEKIVYFENYDGTNGPDLFVYLAKDLEANEYVDLGRAKGNQGDIIYGVPLDVDLSEYKYVITWCKAFSELFDYAEIN